MIRVLSTNITSPLGLSTQSNLQAVCRGESALKARRDWCGIPEQITASIFDEEILKALMLPGFSKFESIVIHSVSEALKGSCIDVASERTVFILSTTKADVGLLCEEEGEYLSPADAAWKIGRHLGFTTEPIVVCNACISGVSAQILAARLLESGEYDHAVVCGADCVSSFTAAGFLSFKALSPFECRPFDIERLGLNLGEAAATIILGPDEGDGDDSWKIAGTAQTNDAYHVSAPAPDGNGVFRAIEAVMNGRDVRLSALSVHGTATMFNDQMESKAIAAAGLGDVPVSALKGYYGHTLGAAGLLESIVTMAALDEGLVPASRGFEEIGVSGKINISAEKRQAEGHSFLKIISGFGACNGALLYSREIRENSARKEAAQIQLLHKVHITPQGYELDGAKMPCPVQGREIPGHIYRTHIDNYPKFHKMDMLSKLAFAASELLLKEAQGTDIGGTGMSRDAIMLFNRSSSIVSDLKHIETFRGESGFYPSPSVFLYTLPNITAGEIAIRNGIKGETNLFILRDKDKEAIQRILKAAAPRGCRVICGWLDYSSDDCFDAELELITLN